MYSVLWKGVTCKEKSGLSNMLKQIVILSIFLFLSYTGNSQNLYNAKLDSLFNVIEKGNNFMGSVAISKNGKVAYSRHIGYSDIATFKKSDNSTKYRIASISKTYTAVLVLKAVEERKIGLDDPIYKYFPEIKNAHKITPRHLLTHRSGIHSFTKDKEYLTYSVSGKSRAEMLKLISNADSDFAPDSKASYSNSNYVLLSYLLEQVYKQSFSEILKNKILKPLRLTSTYFGSKIDVQKNEANSYKLDKTWKLLPETDVAIFTGAGAVVSTPVDVLNFVQAVFSNKIISKASLKMMVEIKDEYGMGIGEFPFEEKVSYGHTGHLDGFSSLFGYFPKQDLSFIIISNGSSVNENDIAVGVLNIIFDIPYSIPDKFE